MRPDTEPFIHDYRGMDIVYGRGTVADMGDRLAAEGLDRAVIVCGSNTGANEPLMSLVRDGLGDRHVGTFTETSPAKSIQTVFDGIELLEEVDADVVVGLGSGSSLDLARFMSQFKVDDRDLDDLLAEARQGEVPPPPSPPDLTPVVAVPTTFAGADISPGATTVVLPYEDSPKPHPIRTRASLWPKVVYLDSAAFETTPTGPLVGSAMNGFDKGVETIYGAGADGVTDATAIRGIEHLRASLPHLGDGDLEHLERAILGVLLVQIDRETSVIHSFGHAIARRYPIQQGVAHAVVAPQAVRYVLERVDGRRHVLAEAFDVEPDADAIVDALAAVRDSLDVPNRIRDLDPIDREDLPEVAEAVVLDHALDDKPTELVIEHEGILEVLERAW